MGVEPIEQVWKTSNLPINLLLLCQVKTGR